MGYVFDFKEAQAYAHWVLQKRNRWTAELENDLMLGLLKPSRGESILNIGCGTGASTLPLLDLGLNVTGIDPSPYMLDISHATLGDTVDLYRGFAEELPFDDNSFNHTFFFISLEFVDNPINALNEACRVAKDKVFIGFINRFALKGLQLRLQGLFSSTIYDKARFFSVWELKRLCRLTAGHLPIAWRTVCQLPNPSAKMIRSFERSPFVQRCPFGTFGGMVMTLIPRLRTRPLAIRYPDAERQSIVTGSAPVRTIFENGDFTFNSIKTRDYLVSIGPKGK
ncbi:MAG: class I SAM-dependent methyltransferase [Desulfobacteraceae bacterium]|nr:class I SAM-dependent methyltransferase [Desulfobacteraceae bacterium]